MTAEVFFHMFEDSRVFTDVAHQYVLQGFWLKYPMLRLIGHAIQLCFRIASLLFVDRSHQLVLQAFDNIVLR